MQFIDVQAPDVSTIRKEVDTLHIEVYFFTKS